MAYIEPNSTIKVMKGVPLDPSYDHTIYWTTEQAREDYFGLKTKFTFTRQMYQRVNKGRLRILKRAEDLYDCNYLAFQSKLDASGQSAPKWFYCFITGVEYINNEVTEISYVIDVMTTYHFDYTLGQCFVEREHSETDAIGDNIVSEDIDVGEYIENSLDIPPLLLATNMRLVVWSTLDNNYQNTGGLYWSNTFSGLVPHVFPLTQAGCTAFINWVNDIPTLKYDNAIVIITVAPADWVDPDYLWGNSTQKTTYDVPVRDIIKRSDGSNVRNNKVKCYPYNYLLVTDHAGNNAEYRFEFFTTKFTVQGIECVKFGFFGSPTPNSSITCVPLYYNLSTGYQEQTSPWANIPNIFNLDEAITLKGFPMASWNADAFKAWLAQSASSNILSGIFAGHMMAQPGTMYGGNFMPANYFATGLSNSVNSAPGVGSYMNTGVASGASRYVPSGAQVRAGVMVAAVAANAYKAIKASPQNRGNQGDFTGLESSLLSLAFVNRRVRPEYVDIIDDYFTRYGYACHKLKVPNRNSRPQFNFVKTVDCLIEASTQPGHGLPAEEEETITKIYNNGITFWKNPANIGDYTVSNAPVST